jgi:hypothetical protein
MSKRSILRVSMLVAGFFAVCAILLSPGFSPVKKNKASEKETVLVQAPAEAIPGSAVTVDEPAIPVITEIEEHAPKQVHPVVRPEQVTKYLKVLLRTLIAPNAP